MSPRCSASAVPASAVTVVPRGYARRVAFNSAGFEAGFVVDDEIVAVNDLRVRADQWDTRSETFKVGDRVSVHVSRRDELKRVEVTIAKRAGDRMAADRRVWRDGDSACEPSQLASTWIPIARLCLREGMAEDGRVRHPFPHLSTAS